MLCRCTVTCPVEIKKDDLVVHLYAAGTPKIPTYVLLSHIANARLGDAGGSLGLSTPSDQMMALHERVVKSEARLNKLERDLGA